MPHRGVPWTVLASLLCLPLLTLHPGKQEPQGALEWERYSLQTPAGPATPRSQILRKLKRFVYTTHKVQAGENAWTIAGAYGSNTPSIQSTNNQELLLIHPGNEILVHNKQGILHRVQNGNGAPETLDSIIRKYEKDPEKARKLKEETLLANHLPGMAMLQELPLNPGQRLLIPNTYLEFDTYRFPFSSRPIVSSAYGMRWHPILKYQRFHSGWDFSKPYGTRVYPSRSGSVIFSGYRSGYGKVVILRHSDADTTLYGHLSQIQAQEGQWVERGKTLLGHVGSTGLSTGPHLHFEVRDKHGRPLNPRHKIGRN
ncbi:MAG: M23 family metallopeptidase [Elusimicrobia bacterium]|nr:M23 family metallopeptidase [Elusimicrobiota bacterium]